MSQPVVVYWPAAVGNTGTISSSQNYAGAGNLILNSNLRNSPVSTSGPYIYDKMIRTVSFTSPNNLSALNITITGLGSAVDGAGNPTQPLDTPIVEVRAGPNVNTVNTAHIFKQIDSIAVSGAAAALSAGFGSSGITEYVFMDYNKIGWYASCQVQVLNRATLLYTTYESLTKPETVNSMYGNLDVFPAQIPGFPVNAGMTAASTNQIAELPFPIVMTWVTISANTTAAEALYFTVLQQGIRS